MGTAIHTGMLRILIVEDERDIAQVLTEALREEGYQTSLETDGQRALRTVQEQAFDLLICDIRLPGADGFDILRAVRESSPGTPVILMSAYGSIPEAVDALRLEHAAHYLAKPFAIDQLLATVAEIEQRLALQRAALATGKGAPEEAIIGQSVSISALRDFVRTVADTDGPVLLTGETGTGKELVSHVIHLLSRRRDEALVAVNCAAFPDALLESELFGHERGAFTGATNRREGRFRAANGGTLFLDEVGDIAPSAQAKLLRVLEDGSFQPLGSDTTLHADVRILSATNADLRAGRENRLREDLFYRLKLFHVHLPPLRERMGDLPLLVNHFLHELSTGELPDISPRAWSALRSYHYPGNIRELRHAIRHALVISRGEEIDLCHLPEELRGGEPAPAAPPRIQSLQDAERGFARDYLLRALRATDWNRTQAAKLLGISRKTLWKRLRDLDINQDGDDRPAPDPGSAH